MHTFAFSTKVTIEPRHCEYTLICWIKTFEIREPTMESRLIDNMQGDMSGPEHFEMQKTRWHLRRSMTRTSMRGRGAYDRVNVRGTSGMRSPLIRAVCATQITATAGWLAGRSICQRENRPPGDARVLVWNHSDTSRSWLMFHVRTLWSPPQVLTQDKGQADRGPEGTDQRASLLKRTYPCEPTLRREDMLSKLPTCRGKK